LPDCRKRRIGMTSPTRGFFPRVINVFFKHSIMATSTNDVRTLQSQASGVASPSVRVNVGSSPDDKVFFVHQDLICSRSGFFENAMKESEKEVPEPKVDLSEEKPDTFALYLELIYVCITSSCKALCSVD
jgi:hypothetical protein